MSNDNDSTQEWLEKFGDTPEGKVAMVGAALCAVTFPIPSPFSAVGVPLIAGAAAVYGLRKLFGG
jgi:hypothetical protein